MNLPRIFHITANVYSPLPARHHSFRIWEELAKGAEEYHVVASAGKLRYSHSVAGNIHLHLLPTLSRRGLAYSLSSWLIVILGIRYRPNRVVTQCPVHGGLAAVVLCSLLRIPLFTEIHGSHYFFPVRPGLRGKVESLLYRTFSRPAFRRSARIRSLSPQMTNQLRQTYGAAIAAKAVEIPTRVDLRIFSPAKTNYDISDPLRVINVGSYLPIKAQAQLIVDLFEAYPHSRLTLVGSGPLAERYAALAEKLGITERVRLIHAQTHNDVATLLAESDVYVQYSRAEGVSRAVFEAMAMGLPVVTTPVGFVEGVLAHDRDVLVLGSAGSETLAAAISQLTGSEELRARLGRHARRRVEDEFEWNSVFSRYRQAIATCGDAE